jgi:malate synthase
MEDLATDRIYRLMIAQRMIHADRVQIIDETDVAVRHTPKLVQQLFDQELDRLLCETRNENDPLGQETLRKARNISEQMILRGEFNPA